MDNNTIMFQSLIGTVQQEYDKKEFFRSKKFQSLIGTVQRKRERKSVIWHLFQSLIGTVQLLYLQYFCFYYTLFFPFFNPFPSKKSVDLSFQKACKPAFLLHSFKIGEMPSRSTDFSGIFLVFLTIFSLQKVPEALILLGWRLTDFFR